MNGARTALLGSTLAYAAVTLLMARGVITKLSTALVGGPVDPALNAGILAWGAQNIPGTQSWFDFPAFYPATDALTLSEHLLGLGPVAWPLYWLTGDVIASYNLTVLATYVLCGVGMFAVVRRVTGSAAASFVAGFAFAFAPYRIVQITHIQVLAVFWAPLALLGLHAYLDTNRKRWLGVFGLCWMMQGATNGYFLVFFSVLVGFWVLWFVVLQRRWRDLGRITVAGVLASLPLIPILLHFVDAHARYLLTRHFDEVRYYSADVSAVLCAPRRLFVYIDHGSRLCRTEGSEGELFPGIAVLALCGVAATLAWRPLGRRTKAQWAATVVSAASLAGAVVVLFFAVSTARRDPVVSALEPLDVPASMVLRLFSLSMTFLVLAVAASPSMWAAARRASIPAFYLLMVPVMWAFTWGPTPALYGRRALTQGLYAWLMLLPGLDGLRVPARFWMMALLCLCIALGVTLSRVLKRRHPAVASLVAVLAACTLVLDGWSTLTGGALPLPPPRPDLIQGGVAITLPMGNPPGDAIAQLDAIRGGWITVNGYSGYEAPHYGVLRYATLNASEVLLDPFLARRDLNVIVDEASQPHIELIERQAGAELVGMANGWRQYRIPMTGRPPLTEPEGERLRIASLSVSCRSEIMRLAIDGDPNTRWECGPQKPGQEMIADLGTPVTVGHVVPALGRFSTDFPKQLVVDTSLDGTTWSEGWSGNVLHQTLEALVTDARVGRVLLPITPRQARYVRLRLTSSDDVWYWTIAELEIWTGR